MSTYEQPNKPIVEATAAALPDQHRIFRNLKRVGIGGIALGTAGVFFLTDGAQHHSAVEGYSGLGMTIFFGSIGAAAIQKLTEAAEASVAYQEPQEVDTL